MKRRSKKRNTQKARPKKRAKVTTQNTGGPKEFYHLNPDFDYFEELKSLMLKPSPQEKGELMRKISALGRIRLAIISGIFLAETDSAIDSESLADLFIVGDDINRRKLTSFLQSIEAEVGKEIKLSIMDKDEFDYRYRMFDRFVRVLLEGPHEKIINKIGI
jgi:hypothetical protein